MYCQYVHAHMASMTFCCILTVPVIIYTYSIMIRYISEMKDFYDLKWTVCVCIYELKLYMELSFSNSVIILLCNIYGVQWRNIISNKDLNDYAFYSFTNFFIMEFHIIQCQIRQFWITITNIPAAKLNHNVI